MALLQPCTEDRMACGWGQWIGPITDHGQVAALRDWLELGQWEKTPAPRHLNTHQFRARASGQTN
jgi:hypothetical protein